MMKNRNTFVFTVIKPKIKPKTEQQLYMQEYRAPAGRKCLDIQQFFSDLIYVR